ncbi:ubiquitin carboxyl-terminal hydrolase 30 isoform X2 [Tympanuchus pallidicinctus]|uniref:ubiquitin carboxyl-terminal hydrolase 30 isoform X2 n=1 Tax=Tympanuchus pallidicinctus TaxID=109042 RepID=UPI0022873EB1|nr:ubiquitin carboxyl-terminal hydrolase 30 isoform X2 [Tympanuchus pallidicinctus]
MNRNHVISIPNSLASESSKVFAAHSVSSSISVGRPGAWPAEPGQHLLHELPAARPVFVPLVHQVAGGVHSTVQGRAEPTQRAAVLVAHSVASPKRYQTHSRRALSCQEVTEDDVLDASCLLEVLRIYRWQISTFEEQDAHELFHVLTSSLEDERDRQPRVTHLFDVHSLEQPEITQKQISCRTRGSLPPMSNHWKSQHPFHGRLTSNMVCKHCEHQSPVRYDTFDSLSLSIPAAVWGHPMTLDHCLHHFISSESVKDVVCDNCTKIQAEGTLNGQSIENQKTTFVKQLKLGKLPQCLCIHLQRLSWSNQGTPLKRHEHVQFNEFLIMDIYKYHIPVHKSTQNDLNQKSSEETKPGTRDGIAVKPSDAEQTRGTKSLLMNGACSSPLFMSSGTFPLAAFPECSPPVYLYRLMAVVVHHGDMHSGHFVTYRRSPPSPKSPLSVSNQWLWISDDTVRKASLQEVLASSAYLLFYERVHSRVQHQSLELRPEE